MRKFTGRPCLSVSLLGALVIGCAVAAVAQDQLTGSTRNRNESNAPVASADPAKILRAARTIYVKPNRYIDAKYLEYKLGKYREFQQWKLAIVKDETKADLILDVHRRAANYIFSIEEPHSSVVVVNGKVVAINGLVAAEDIAREIIKRMSATRALPTNDS